MSSESNKVCPICKKDNNCGNRKGEPQGTCWCDREVFPKEIFVLIPSDELEKSCICIDCLNKFKTGEQ